MSAKKVKAYLGQVLKSQSENKYYRQSNIEGLLAISGNEEIEVVPSQALSVKDLDDVSNGQDKFNVAGIDFYEAEQGDKMGQPTYRTIRIFNVIERKDGKLAAKVACDQLIAFRDGKKIKFNKGDYLNLETKEDKLQGAKYLLDNGYYDQEKYDEKVAKINKQPDFVLFNLTGKGELV